MFRKTILKTAALAIVSATIAATGVSTASAGNYGYDGHGGYNKYSGARKAIGHRPFAHIQDRIWQQHVDWCQGRFRTYNTYDNTYKPYSGPRAQCWSPYIAR